MKAKMLKNNLPFLSILLAYLVFPDLISWINDEPLLILTAINSLESGEIVQSGLYGSKNIPFGPIAIWFYQICLLFTSSLTLIVQIKTVCFVCLIYFSSLKICSELSIDKKLAFLPLLSPYVFHYSRILWDNCFLIPSSFLFIALLLSFWRKSDTKKLIALTVLATLMFQIHLTSLLLIIPAVLISLWITRIWIKNHIASIFLSLFILLALNYNYFNLLVENYHNIYEKSDSNPILITLFGFINFSAFNFYNFFIPEIHDTNLSILVKCLKVLSLSPLLICLISINNKFILRKNAPFLFMLIISVPIPFIVNLKNFPHYFNSLLPIYIIIVLLIINQSKFKKLFVSAYSLTLIASIFLFQFFIYSNSGTKSPRYGATLGNQLEIVSIYNPDISSLQTNVKNYQLFPHSLLAISKIIDNDKPKTKNLAIVYKYQDIRGKIIALAKP